MRAKHMPVRPSDLQFDPSSRALLRAVGIGESLGGAVRALEVARYCFSAANEQTGEAAFASWSSTAKRLETQLRAADNEATLSFDIHEFASTERDSLPARLAALQCPQSPSSSHQALSTLVARAIIAASVSGQSIGSTFVDGIHTLQGAIAGKGRRSPDWQALLGKELLDAGRLRAQAESLGPQSPAYSFLVAACSAVGQAVASPELFDRVAQVPEPVVAGGGSAVGNSELTDSRPRGSGENQPAAATRASQDTTPNIVGRLKAATTASVAEKFGLHHWDYLLPSDLAAITHKLGRLLDSEERTMQVYSALAQTSLLTSCSDSVAVNLRFDMTNNIWLDLEVGVWCWDFEEYRSHVAPDSEQRPRDPMPTFLPAPLVMFLRRVRQSFPLAETLGAALAGYGGNALDLEHFREFLRSLGNTAHPAYRGRFARSLVHVYLAETGSDMGAALATGQFAVCAPAALFYFGPSAQIRYERTQKVYRFLGLGEPVRAAAYEGRIGASKVPDPVDLKAGWQGLVAEINAALRLLRSVEETDQATVAGELMVLLCAALIVQTAHRATRIDCLTFSALYAHPECIAIFDKDEVDRHPGRLLPKTRQVRLILAAAAECHRIVSRQSSIVGAGQPIFVQWAQDEGPKCLSTSDIAAVIRRHFQDRDPNFARSAWITYLDEHGCDRWLIRVLTGHTRDVTRTSEPYFDTAPVAFAECLGSEMQRVGMSIFGDDAIEAQEEAGPVVQYRLRASNSPAERAPFRVPDPRSLLDGITGNTLIGWRAADRVRQAIASGEMEEPAAVRAVLSLLFLDLVPDAATCINAVTEPQKYLRRYGRQLGVLWHRQHFVHPTWIPIGANTERLIAQTTARTKTKKRLKTATGRALHRLDDYWPRIGKSAWSEVERVQRHFLRIEFPPSLQAVAHPSTPAPALSDLSLMRLASDEHSALPVASPPAELERNLATRTEKGKSDTKTLQQLVYPSLSTTERLGELQKRAGKLRENIQENFEVRSPHSAWIFDWVMDELEQTARLANGRLDISSLYTYLGWLTRQSPTLDGLDPYEWNEAEWAEWIDYLNAPMASRESVDPSNAPLAKPVRDAVRRLVWNRQRRQQHVPWSVRSRLAQADEPQACGSASATLLLDDDIARARELCARWLEGKPLDLLIMQARFSGHDFPSRTSEISSLGLDCLTPGGALVIERKGFKVHKTENAIRVVLLDAGQQSEFRRLQPELAEYHPDGADLLLRGDGSAQAGRRDVNLARMLTASLKVVTGDAQARVHCVRAKSLQDIAWPGWGEKARQMLLNGVPVQSAADWVAQLSPRPLRLTFGSVQAGHGDLRPALGNYLAAWPLVFHLHASALLTKLPPARQMLRQLGAKANSYAQAYHRSGRLLSVWDWLQAQGPAFQFHAPLAHASVAEPPNTCDDPDASTASSDSEIPADATTALTQAGGTAGHEGTGDTTLAPGLRQDAEGPHAPAPTVTADIDRCSRTTYLTALMLGLSKPRAMECAALTLPAANHLDAICPSTSWSAWATRRARAQPGPRGEAANLRLLLRADRSRDPLGRQIIDWVCAIGDSSTLYSVVFRRTSEEPREDRLIKLWNEMANRIPSGACLVIHRRRFSSAERGEIARLGLAASGREDRNIGSFPLLKLYPRDSDNRVLSSRYTSIFRAAVCARAATENALPGFE